MVFIGIQNFPIGRGGKSSNIIELWVKHEIFEIKFSNSKNEIFEKLLGKIVRGLKFSKIQNQH